MMADFYGQAEALEQIEAELNLTFTWSGGSYPCIYGDRTESKELGYGGFALDSDVTVVVRKDAFSSGNGPFPQPKDDITLDSRSLNIQSVDYAPDGSSLVLACNDPTRGV